MRRCTMIGEEIYYFYDSEELMSAYDAGDVSEIEKEDFLQFVLHEGNALQLSKEEIKNSNLNQYDSYVKFQIVETGEISHTFSLKANKKIKK